MAENYHTIFNSSLTVVLGRRSSTLGNGCWRQEVSDFWTWKKFSWSSQEGSIVMSVSAVRPCDVESHGGAGRENLTTVSVRVWRGDSRATDIYGGMRKTEEGCGRLRKTLCLSVPTCPLSSNSLSNWQNEEDRGRLWKAEEDSLCLSVP